MAEALRGSIAEMTPKQSYAELLRIVALAALLFVQACHEASIGRERANAYFNGHRTALEQVVERAGLCRPETGRIDRSADFHCTSSEDPRDLKGAMERANAKWIRVYYDNETGQRSLRAVHIALRSEGMAFAGVMEEFVFESAPALHAEYERKDYGVGVIERQPVTGPPHHWYWRRLER